MAMECSLLYVSRVTIDAERLDDEFDAIIARAHVYNARVGITGGVVRVGGYFAQVLEGSSEAVKTLMQHIDRDPRHADVSVLRIAARDKRQFDGWLMAYAGESRYLGHQITQLLAPDLGEGPERIDRLETLIVAMAAMS
ncbi:MAG: BLUF domain-containing protein [Sphingomonas sp.]